VLEFDGNDEKTLNESFDLTRRLKSDGLDMINVSIGFSTPKAKIPWAPAFMGPIAKRVRRAANIPVSAAWGFGEPALADKAGSSGQLDLAMVGKAHLANPHCAYHAARELKIDRASWTWPAPYAHWLERY
jgi:2,4-dienoyl-CoA reductase-like NADH-dependent reductase (Old Yellow Enzyme family)